MDKGIKDSEKCVRISTKYALAEMFKPGVIVLGTPFLVGIVIGP